MSIAAADIRTDSRATTPEASRGAAHRPDTSNRQEMTVRDLCSELEALARSSFGRSKESIDRDIERLLVRAQGSSTVQKAMERAGTDQFREHMKGLFSASYEHSHKESPPDGLNTFQRGLQWCDGAIDGLKHGVIQGLEIQAKLQKWVNEGIVKAGQWAANADNWKELAQSLGALAAQAWEGVKNATITMFESIKTTLTDPKKRAEFFRKLLTGELYVDFFNAVVGGVVDVLSALSKTTGVTDLGLGVVSVLKGDMDSAKKHFGESWHHFSDTVGIADLVRFSELTIRAIQEDDPKLFYQGLGNAGLGVVKVALTVATVGEGTALLQSARAAAITFSYRGVAATAEGLAAQQLAKVSAARVMSVVTKEELEGMGERAAIQVSKKVEAEFAKHVDDVAGAGTYERALTSPGSSKLDDAAIEKINARLNDPKVQDEIVEKTSAAAEEAGYETAEELIRTASSRLGNKDAERFMNMNNKELRAQTRRMSSDEIQELVKAHSPDLSPAEVARTAKAYEYITKGVWKYSEESQKVFAQKFSTEFTDILMEGGIKDGFDKTWQHEMARLKSRLKALGVEMPEELATKIDDAARSGFRQGFERRIVKLADEDSMRRIPRQRAATSNERKQAHEGGRKGQGKGVELDSQANKESNYTIDEAEYAKLSDARFKARTNEDVLRDVDEEARSRKQTHGGKESDAGKGPQRTGDGERKVA